MAREDWGATFDPLTRQILRTSPSALSKADPNAPYGCPRKFYLSYIKGVREPMGEAAAKGVKIHKEIELYLKNGKKALSAIAMSALKYYPTPCDPNLELEHECSPPEGFEVAGIPVLMYLDCISPYAKYIDPMGADQEDPTGTVEVIDWKSKGNLTYALTNQQLLDTTQMIMYGAYVMRRYDTEHARLSHVYLQTKGKKKASKSTILVTPETIGQKWPRIEALGRDMIDYAKETDINKIPANLRECEKCFYSKSGMCPKNTNQTLEMIFGKATDMGMLPPQTQTLDTAGHLAALQAEDRKSFEIPEGFAAALAFIQVHGFGVPGLKGDAYLAACSTSGIAPDAVGSSAGSGKAGDANIILSEPAQALELANEVAGQVGQPFVIPARVIPADAPESKPELAADPVPGFDVRVGVKVSSPVKVTPALIPGVDSAPTQEEEARQARNRTPALIETVSPQTPDTGSIEFQKCLAAHDKGGKWGPVKKPDLIIGFTELLARRDALALKTQPDATATTIVAQAFDQLEARTVQIYIDCMPTEGTNLAPWVENFTALMCEQYSCKDVRLADAKSDLGFGKWKGALAVCVAESYKALEPGAYYLDTRGNEILEAAAAGFTVAQVTARGIR